MRGWRAQLDLQSVALVVFVAVESANVRRDDMLSTDSNAKGAGWMSRTTRTTRVTRRRRKERRTYVVELNERCWKREKEGKGTYHRSPRVGDDVVSFRRHQ